MITLNAFRKEFSILLSSLEKRRRRYLKLFYLGVIISTILIFVSIFYPVSILSSILDLFHMPTTVKTSDIISLVFFALLCSGLLILIPIYNYRGTNRSAALQTFRFHRFSLKDEVYSKLLRLFGSFEFAPRGGIYLVEMRKSTIFPDHQLYLTEDFVVGELNNITVKLCEANISKVENRERVSAFKGLLIFLDISEIKVKLRGDFHGRTVLIHDPKKTAGEIMTKYHSMQRLSLPEKFEPMLEGYTTNMAEAQSVVTADLLESLDAFAVRVQQLTQQVNHWDDRMAYAAAEIYDYIKGKLLSALGHPKLPSEIVYDEQYGTNLDITKSDPMCEEVTSLNKHFELEFYEDKFVVAIPCKFDLFETNSLFEPALNDEDADLLYHMMVTLNQLTEHLNRIKA